MSWTATYQPIVRCLAGRERNRSDEDCGHAVGPDGEHGAGGDLLVASGARGHGQPLDRARRRIHEDHLSDTARTVERPLVADGAAALQTFLRDPDLLAHIEIDGVITVIDAPSAYPLLGADGTLAVRTSLEDQIALADVIVLNRVALTTERATDQLAWTLHFANPRATVIRASDPGLSRRALHNGGFTASGIDADRRTVATPRAPRGAPAVVRLAVDGDLEGDAVFTWTSPCPS